MRIALLILGGLLLIQVALHVIQAIAGGDFSFTALGAQLDRDAVRLTAGLTAVATAGILHRRGR